MSLLVQSELLNIGKNYGEPQDSSTSSWLAVITALYMCIVVIGTIVHPGSRPPANPAVHPSEFGKWGDDDNNLYGEDGYFKSVDENMKNIIKSPNSGELGL
ncbi:hypothetical protein HELRODRAFT_162980 [Helobdella robusta]|uniref:Uncharacterized protein n=1 Tax=Helobdella robusta TaxID=6412 RepID=T1ETH4_HELRO|nr:hypothetical protein HELRODRAFT_162980 [Helobdella robusta]ESN99432.1 hypothetical protein HELRODRAFT_162980 [Helobdella robusta]